MVRDYGFKLSTLQRIVAETGTTPIFDLNVLTSNLADQLAMLRSASALGIPVRYIELGNEFYLSDTNYTYTRVFPTSADYAGLVAKWAPRIRAAFTDVKIAAVGSLPQVTPREKIWNAAVLSIAGPDIDALTLHDYAGLPRSTGTPGLLASAYTNGQEVQQVIFSVPARYGIWITKFNLSKQARSMGSPHAGATSARASSSARLPAGHRAPRPRAGDAGYARVSRVAVIARSYTAAAACTPARCSAP